MCPYDTQIPNTIIFIINITIQYLRRMNIVQCTGFCKLKFPLFTFPTQDNYASKIESITGKWISCQNLNLTNNSMPIIDLKSKNRKS